MCWFYEKPKCNIHVKSSTWRGNKVSQGRNLIKRIIFNFCSRNDLEIYKLPPNVLQRILCTKIVLNCTLKIHQEETICINNQIIFQRNDVLK